MIKDNKIKPEYIIGIIIPFVIVGLIIFAANRGNDTYQSSKFEDISNKNDTKENNNNLLSKTSTTKNEILDKNISNQIIGEWEQNNHYRITIYKENSKYYLGEENKGGIRKDYELIERNIQGYQTFIVKELLEGTNVPNDVKFINDYTDYYVIDKNGNLGLYDKEGLIEKYRKIE